MRGAADWSLSTRCEQIATSQPDDCALITATGTLSFAQLYRHSRQVASALTACGVRSSDRVAVIGPDTEVFFQLLIACSQIGAIIVPINWRLTDSEITYIVGDCDPKLVFTDRSLGANITSRVRALDPVAFGSWRNNAESAAPTFGHDPDRPIALMYTSGTTGNPKGALLAERTFFAVAQQLKTAHLDWIDWHHQDVNLVPLPSFHIGGLWWSTQSLNCAVTTVVMDVFDPGAALQLIATHGVTTVCLVPSMLQLLLAELRQHSPGAATTLRKVVYGGSPIAPDLLASAQSILQCDLVQIYGLTETGNTAVCLPSPDHREPARNATYSRLLAAGRPYPDVQVRIVDARDRDVPCGCNGEVLIKSGARMLKYWNQPDATAATLTADGWVRTGDVGFVDPDGFLFIRDRIKDVIIVAGENVYPAEVEKVLHTHRDVREVAVIGIPDEQWGEQVHAVVALADDRRTPVAELARHVNQRLAGYKAPRSYEFVEAIPRNSSGKILRRTLREPYWSDRSREVN